MAVSDWAMDRKWTLADYLYAGREFESGGGSRGVDVRFWPSRTRGWRQSRILVGLLHWPARRGRRLVVVN